MLVPSGPPIILSPDRFEVTYEVLLPGVGATTQTLSFAIAPGQPLRFSDIAVGPPQSPSFHVTFVLRSTGGELVDGPLWRVTPSGTLTSPAKLISELIDKTLAYLDLPALKPALKARLEAAAKALVAKKPAVACNALKLYIAAVKAAPARVLTSAEKAELVADATLIATVIGCA